MVTTSAKVWQRMDLHDIFWRGWSWPKNEMVRVRLALIWSPLWIRDLPLGERVYTETPVFAGGSTILAEVREF